MLSNFNRKIFECGKMIVQLTSSLNKKISLTEKSTNSLFLDLKICHFLRKQRTKMFSEFLSTWVKSNKVHVKTEESEVNNFLFKTK